MNPLLNQDHLEHVKEAKERIAPYIHNTPLIKSEYFSKEYHNQVYLKTENLQKTGAFKIRGAFNKLLLQREEAKKNGVITASAGNHAQGVSLSAQTIGCQATIVMPKATPVIKVDATKQYGAQVILHGNCYDEAYAHALSLAKKENKLFVHPFDDAEVLYGQGTLALEIHEECKDADYLLIPVGGGGLISGIASIYKQLNPNIRILGVEPEGAMSMKASLASESPITLPSVHTIADGVAVKRVGDLTLSFVKEYVDGIITVSDYDIMDSFLMLLEKHKMVCESAGALSLAD